MPRAEIIDFWAMVFNPSSMTRLGHVIIGCWLAGAFFVMSVSAYYLLKKRHLEFAKQSLKIGLCVGLASVVLQAMSGDHSGEVIAQHQPAKLAALEGVFKTEAGAPLTLFGVPDPKQETIHYSIQIPKLLSYLSFSDFDAEVKGLDQVPKKDWPNVSVVFQTYRLMLLMWFGMLVSL